MDLGSAVLSAETALDLMPEGWRERVLLCEAPLVEGAVAAAVAARLGAGLQDVAAEARRGLAGKEAHLGDGGPRPEASAPEPEGDWDEATVVVGELHGLHARPAARLVRAVGDLDAEVRVENLTAGRGPAPARSLSGLSALGALQGHELRVRARGPDAAAALAAAREIVEGPGPPPPRPPRPRPSRRRRARRSVASRPHRARRWGRPAARAGPSCGSRRSRPATRPRSAPTWRRPSGRPAGSSGPPATPWPRGARPRRRASSTPSSWCSRTRRSWRRRGATSPRAARRPGPGGRPSRPPSPATRRSTTPICGPGRSTCGRPGGGRSPGWPAGTRRRPGRRSRASWWPTSWGRPRPPSSTPP